MDPRFRGDDKFHCWCHPRESGDPKSVGGLPVDRIKQVPPRRIVAFNQLNLPSAPPFLHGLFSGDGFCDVGEYLNVDECRNGIAFGKSVSDSVAVFQNTSGEVAGHANVQRAVSSTGQNVYEILMFHARPKVDPRFRGDDTERALLKSNCHSRESGKPATPAYSISRMTASTARLSPAAALTNFTTPAFSARRIFSIFIASTTASGCPASTLSPAAT